MQLDSKLLRSRLAQILPIIEEECTNNLNFAEKILRIINTQKEISTLCLDPFEIFARSGDEGLESAIKNLSNEEIILIIRQYRLDPSRLAMKWKNRERLMQFVIDRIKGLATKGSVFHTYGQHIDNLK